MVGQTAAFALPILERLAEDPYGVFAVVLTAGRELAQQIAEQFVALGSTMALRVAVVTGGADMVAQCTEVRSHVTCFPRPHPQTHPAPFPQLNKMPHVIVATPGRLAAILQSGSVTVRLGAVQFLVLDEADRLLDATIAPDLDVILAAIPSAKAGRRTLLFSATMSKNVSRLQALALTQPYVWSATDAVRLVHPL